MPQTLIWEDSMKLEAQPQRRHALAYALFLAMPFAVGAVVMGNGWYNSTHSKPVMERRALRVQDASKTTLARWEWLEAMGDRQSPNSWPKWANTAADSASVAWERALATTSARGPMFRIAQAADVACEAWSNYDPAPDISESCIRAEYFAMQAAGADSLEDRP
jgi:hypothetical protein